MYGNLTNNKEQQRMRRNENRNIGHITGQSEKRTYIMIYEYKRSVTREEVANNRKHSKRPCRVRVIDLYGLLSRKRRNTKAC